MIKVLKNNKQDLFIIDNCFLNCPFFILFSFINGLPRLSFIIGKIPRCWFIIWKILHCWFSIGRIPHCWFIIGKILLIHSPPLFFLFHMKFINGKKNNSKRKKKKSKITMGWITCLRAQMIQWHDCVVLALIALN